MEPKYLRQLAWKADSRPVESLKLKQVAHGWVLSDGKKYATGATRSETWKEWVENPRPLPRPGYFLFQKIGDSSPAHIHSGDAIHDRPSEIIDDGF